MGDCRLRSDRTDEVAKTTGTITPGSVSPSVMMRLMQKDAPRIAAARQRCEGQKQQAIEALRIKREADEAAERMRIAQAKAQAEEDARQAKLEAAEHERGMKAEAAAREYQAERREQQIKEQAARALAEKQQWDREQAAYAALSPEEKQAFVEQKRAAAKAAEAAEAAKNVEAKARLAEAKAANSNRLQIQFQRGVSHGSYLSEVVSMRNTSDNYYATVGWDCKFYDNEDFKVGEGYAVFYLVRKQSVTFDTMTFPLSIAIGYVKKIQCDLTSVEEVTKENGRLYTPGTSWGSDSLGSAIFNEAYKSQGDAAAPPVTSTVHYIRK